MIIQSEELSFPHRDGVALSARQVSCIVGHRRVVQSGSLTVRWGEIVGLLGHSGAGKTTFLSCLSGLCCLDEGLIELSGTPYGELTAQEARRQGVATLLQTSELVSRLDVAANVWLGNEPIRWKFFVHRRRMVEETNMMLQQWGFALPAEGVPVSHLSRGQQQAVILLRALASGGRIFLLDEPMAAVSHHERKRFFDVLAALRQKGLAVLCAFHNVADAVQVADRLVVMRQGCTIDAGLVGSLDSVQLLSLMG